MLFPKFTFCTLSLSKSKKNFGYNFPHFERVTKYLKKRCKILLACTCTGKKKAALLHSQSGSTALRTISAAGSGGCGAQFFDMMKRVKKKVRLRR
jgi:hypothetical protein